MSGKRAVILLLYCFTSGMLFPCLSVASDRDVDPYMIYVDPVTGKYTTQKPGHETPQAAEPVKPAAGETVTSARPTVADRSGIVSVLIISLGIILFSHLLALGLTRSRKTRSRPDKH